MAHLERYFDPASVPSTRPAPDEKGASQLADLIPAAQALAAPAVALQGARKPADLVPALNAPTPAEHGLPSAPDCLARRSSSLDTPALTVPCNTSDATPPCSGSSNDHASAHGKAGSEADTLSKSSKAHLIQQLQCVQLGGAASLWDDVSITNEPGGAKEAAGTAGGRSEQDEGPE